VNPASVRDATDRQGLGQERRRHPDVLALPLADDASPELVGVSCDDLIERWIQPRIDRRVSVIFRRNLFKRGPSNDTQYRVHRHGGHVPPRILDRGGGYELFEADGDGVFVVGIAHCREHPLQRAHEPLREPFLDHASSSASRSGLGCALTRRISRERALS